MNESEDFNAILRQALHDEASHVEPGGEGLAVIRGRTSAGKPWYRRSWVAAVATAGVATAATVVGVTVLTDPGGRETAGPAGHGSPTSSSEPTTPPPRTSPTSATPTTTPPNGAAGLIAVPVYYPGGPTTHLRLYREFHSMPAPDGAAVAAVSEMLKGTPHDPDYQVAPWGSRVLSVIHKNGLITVDLTKRPTPYKGRNIGPDSPLARLLVQQLVYTVQAAEQSSDPVLLTRRGQPIRTINGVDTRQPILRADPIDVQGMVWITSPAQGATVSSPVHVEGLANVFEANVSWQVLQGDTMVRSGFTTAATAMQFAPFSTTIKLASGDYTLRFFETSAKDGSAINVDTKDITVR